MVRRNSLWCGLAMLSVPAVSSAALFEESFDADHTATWIFNSSTAGDTANDNANQEANFFFDYSTVGIAPAPNSVGGTTRGLKLEANIPDADGGLFNGLSVSPVGQSFSGDYRLRFDLWHNYPTSGVGSTQMLGGGLGTTGTVAQFPGTSIEGVFFNASSDGGTTQDYRAYVNVGAPLLPSTGAYAAGTTDSPAASDSRNNVNSYYADFGNEPVPADQITLFPAQSGSSPVGSQGFAWHDVVIEKVGDVVTYTIDGTRIATVDVSNEPFAGSNIFLGLHDINNGTTDAAGRPLNFGLIDNVRVDIVPEPAALGLAAVGALGLLRRRRVR